MKKSSVYTPVGHPFLASFSKSDAILFRYANVQQQKCSSDCGLFACAFATALCLGVDVTNITFEQSEMRTHMKNCLQKRKPELFHTERRISHRLCNTIIPFYGGRDYIPSFQTV